MVRIRTSRYGYPCNEFFVAQRLSVCSSSNFDDIDDAADLRSIETHAVSLHYATHLLKACFVTSDPIASFLLWLFQVPDPDARHHAQSYSST